MRNHTVIKKVCGNFGLRRVYHWDRYRLGDKIRVPIDLEKDNRYKVQSCVHTAMLNKQRHGMKKKFKIKNCYKHILMTRIA